MTESQSTQPATPQTRSYRDLLMAKQNGFDVDDYKLFVWHREEELIRSLIAFPQQYASCNLCEESFDGPLHRLAWSAIASLIDSYPGVERLEDGDVVSTMKTLDADCAAFATTWMIAVMGDLPVSPRVGLDQVVKDIFYHQRLKRYAGFHNGFFKRVGKETSLAEMQAELVGMSRDIIYEYEGEGFTSPPLSDVEWDARDTSKINVVRTGIKAIDRAAGGGHGRGELLVWGGGTSHGKSFAAQRLLRLQAQLGQRALYISCEDAIELMFCRMLADYCEPSVSPKDIRMRAADPEVVEAAQMRMRAELADKITVVEHKKPTVDQVCNTIRYYRYARHIDMVIVDYLQAINDDQSKGQKVMDTANVISKLKKCFTQCKVAGVVLTQYARNEYREGEEPSINAAKYAGDIENEAEILAFMWRDAENNLKVKLPKVKWSSAKQLRYVIPVNQVTGCHQEWQEDFSQ